MSICRRLARPPLKRCSPTSDANSSNQYGRSFLMTVSWTPMSMEFRSSFKTELQDASFLVYSPIPPTTLKSLWLAIPVTTLINSIFRVLLSCIKFLGNHPCPRCLVEKNQISQLGTRGDIKRRKQSERVDDGLRKRLVEQARRKIYVRGTPVNSKIISTIIGIRSLTPTRVSLQSTRPPQAHPIKERLLSTPWSTWGRLPRVVCR